MNETVDISGLPFAHGGPVGTGQFRARVEDFQVIEDTGVVPDGRGEHVWLCVRKRDTNTEWLARRLAKFAGVPARAVSYAGLKDRRALTTQWFSVHLPGREEPDWEGVNSSQLEVLDHTRHARKLQRGCLRGNRFVINVTDLGAEPHDLEARLARIAAQGVPNYFGEQRFGRDGDNIAHAAAMLSGAEIVRDRHLRGLYLSAARSVVFNATLARRVSAGTWNAAITGDVMVLTGSRSHFVLDAPDPAVVERVRDFDVHPSGPLWAGGETAARGEAGAVEADVLLRFATWSEGLRHAGLREERRPLRVAVDELSWEFVTPRTLRLRFGLPAGAYATAVLRELVCNPEVPEARAAS